MLPENIRIELQTFFDNFSLSELYKKSACKNKYQKIIANTENCNIEIKQKRLYPDSLSYKTNCSGDIFVKIEYDNSNYDYSYPPLLYNIEWQHEDRNFRLIVPNNILDKIQPFIAIAIARNLPVISTEYEQIIYYTEDLGEVAQLIAAFPVIINETKNII